jgi:hypothetical protein
MTNLSRVSQLLLSVSALMGALFVLDTTGVVSLMGEQSSLRGGRRLQMGSGYAAGAGMQAAQQGAEYGGQAAQQGLQYGGQAVGQVHEGVQQGVQQGLEYGSQAHQGVQQGVQQGLGYGQDALHRGAQYGGQLANQVATNPYQSITQGLRYNPQDQLFGQIPAQYKFLLFLAQVIFSVFYFCMVVMPYPKWYGPSPMSQQLQAEPAPCATTSSSPSNCCLSFLCPQARAAHTFDKTGVLEYWCGLIAMFLCPFCTLCWANACTDLNPKLGGEQANIIQSAVCTWCCSCCVIAQDAESLDAATGARTEPCGVSGGMGPGMMPGQQMMYPRY